METPSADAETKTSPSEHQLPAGPSPGLNVDARSSAPMRRARSLEQFGTSPRLTLRSSQPLDPEGSPPTTSRSAGTNAPSPFVRHNSDLTVDGQRFERMMERFQLRRLPIAAPVSTIYTRRNSMDRNTLASSRRNSRRSSFFTSAAGGHNSHDSAVSSTSKKSLTRLARVYYHDIASVVADTTWWIKLSLSMTTEVVSIATRIRLAILSIALTFKLVHVPFAIAYAGHTGMANASDVTVDVVFFLNILATCNTATLNAQRRIVSTRRAIWRHYRRNGFLIDLLSALPIEMVLLDTSNRSWVHWVVGVGKLVLQAVCVNRHLQIFHTAWSKEVISADQSAAAWMLFSRYSHLIRISRIVLYIVLVAHYFACMWSWLHVDVDPDFFDTRDTYSVYIATLYEAFQLLQGQGVEAKTTGQAAFGSVAVLLGSILLAVMFGNVAILVANFSANTTAYQRKMEQVFSVMGKLELPHPIRERVHQYYEYLHIEYESLDGEVVKFAKDLSHTLELEVVLFKYMDVLMQVPHWRGCSPDFQKQLVLNLTVRVYLPDDFVMRRGEVGTECYLINRGTCKLYEYPTGNYEPPTVAMAIAPDDDIHTARRNKMSSTNRSARSMGPQRNDTDVSGMKDGPHSHFSVLRRGQAIGEVSLLANYERSSDLRAVTYVEMCVIERTAFQQLLTRYPRDREVVVTSIVRHHMLSLDAQGVPCPYMKMVKRVKPDVTTKEAIEQVSRAMNPTRDDPSILFGMSTQVFGRLQRGFAEANDANGSPASSGHAASRPSHDSELDHTVQDLETRLRLFEQRQATAIAACTCRVAGKAPAPAEPQHPPRSQLRGRRRRRSKTNFATDWLVVSHESKRGSAPPALPRDAAAGHEEVGEVQPAPPAEADAQVSAGSSVGVVDANSPTLYADKLFYAKPTIVDDRVGRTRRGSMRRLLSTRL